MRLTMAKIFSERPEIEKRVYERYPVTSKEKRCLAEKQKKEWQRFELAKQQYLNNES